LTLRTISFGTITYSGGQISDRAMVREELMGPYPPKLFTLGRTMCCS